MKKAEKQDAEMLDKKTLYPIFFCQTRNPEEDENVKYGDSTFHSGVTFWYIVQGKGVRFEEQVEMG